MRMIGRSDFDLLQPPQCKSLVGIDSAGMPTFFVNQPLRRGKVERWSLKIQLSPPACLNIGVFRKSRKRRGEEVGCLAALEIA